MTTQVRVSIEERLGVITLNRPEAINALNQEMIDAIRGVLDLWATDEQVGAVLFEALGSKGFCAGGDVRAVRRAMLEGEHDVAERFFASEYAMNREIATYPKPVAVIADGVVMGGGIGIAGHARYRFTTPTARFAMPEAAIGFFCDVGVNELLRKAPEHRALLFALSGQAVGAADALALGLTDCAVASERLAALRDRIVAAASRAHVDAALAKLVEAEAIEAGERVFCAMCDQLAEVAALGSATDIVSAIATSGLAPDLARVLQSRSLISQAAILASHRAARRLGNVAHILEMDLRLARLLRSLPDFAEGVRAVLVDKDHAPNWQTRVPHQEIAMAVAG